MSDIDAPRLIAAARAAAASAHAPYSRFRVGAALLLTDDSIVTGCNVENASYGLSLCAETVAVAKAASEGRLADIVAVGVAGGSIDGHGEAVVRPCGRCRQILNEAADMGGRDIAVICSGVADGPVERHWLSDLLPDAFGPTDLGISRRSGRPRHRNPAADPRATRPAR